MEELIITLLQNIKDILLTINSNIEELNANVESLTNGGAYSISDVCDKLDSIASTMSSIETYNEPRKQDRQNGQNKLECSYG